MTPVAAVPAHAHRDGGIDALVAGVAADGYAIVPHFIPDDVVARLRARAEEAHAQSRMHPARVGRASAAVRDPGVRGDTILWLDDPAADPTEGALHASLEAVRLAVNAALWLGLFDFEGHYARYPAGAFYARHLDRFRDQDTRALSFVLYLNADWPDGAGGALRLHREDAPPLDVLPCGGTLAAFLADRFEHEVLPADRTRWSFTGWFRRRPL